MLGRKKNSAAHMWRSDGPALTLLHFFSTLVVGVWSLRTLKDLLNTTKIHTGTPAEVAVNTYKDASNHVYYKMIFLSDT
jgi:hypothetical protein